MTKISGVGSQFWYGAADLSGDIGAVTGINSPRGVLPLTAISETAEDRGLGRRDGNMAFNAFWNTAAGQAHLVATAIGTADVIATCSIGTAVGVPTASLLAKQSDYSPSLGADGSLVAAIAVSANGSPVEWGELLTTGKQTFASGSVNGASIDFGSTSTLFGAAAYLHVFSLGSGTPTVTVADSANDSSYSAITGMAFTPTVAGASRLQGAANATVRRYVRVQVTGTYTALVCALTFVRYLEDPSI